MPLLHEQPDLARPDGRDLSIERIAGLSVQGADLSRTLFSGLQRSCERPDPKDKKSEKISNRQSTSDQNKFQNKQELKELKKLISQCEKKISVSESRLNEIDSALCEPEVLLPSNL